MGSSLYGLALGVLSSVVSCFYYIRLIKIMYFEQPSQLVTYGAIDHKAIFRNYNNCNCFFLLCPHSLFLWTYKVAYMFLG